MNIQYEKLCLFFLYFLCGGKSHPTSPSMRLLWDYRQESKICDSSPSIALISHYHNNVYLRAWGKREGDNSLRLFFIFAIQSETSCNYLSIIEINTSFITVRNIQKLGRVLWKKVKKEKGRKKILCSFHVVHTVEPVAIIKMSYVNVVPTALLSVLDWRSAFTTSVLRISSMPAATHSNTRLVKRFPPIFLDENFFQKGANPV